MVTSGAVLTCGASQDTSNIAPRGDESEGGMLGGGGGCWGEGKGAGGADPRLHFMAKDEGGRRCW